MPLLLVLVLPEVVPLLPVLPEAVPLLPDADGCFAAQNTLI